jgi:hypothetical protein
LNNISLSGEWTTREAVNGDLYVLDGDDTTIAVIPSSTRGKDDIAHQVACLPALLESLKKMRADLYDLNSAGAHYEADKLGAMLGEMRVLA